MAIFKKCSFTENISQAKFNIMLEALQRCWNSSILNSLDIQFYHSYRRMMHFIHMIGFFSVSEWKVSLIMKHCLDFRTEEESVS